MTAFASGTWLDQVAIRVSLSSNGEQLKKGASAGYLVKDHLCLAQRLRRRFHQKQLQELGLFLMLFFKKSMLLSKHHGFALEVGHQLLLRQFHYVP